MALTGALPAVTAELLREHLGAAVPEGVMLHLRLIEPVYPLAAVTLTMELAVSPAVTEFGDNAVAVSV